MLGIGPCHIEPIPVIFKHPHGFPDSNYGINTVISTWRLIIKACIASLSRVTFINHETYASQLQRRQKKGTKKKRKRERKRNANIVLNSQNLLGAMFVETESDRKPVRYSSGVFNRLCQQFISSTLLTFSNIAPRLIGSFFLVFLVYLNNNHKSYSETV